MELSEKQILSIFRFGLGKGIIGLDAIENWARKVLNADQTRTDHIAELGNANKLGTNETLSLLFNNSDKIDSPLWQTVFGLIVVRLKTEAVTLKQACYAIEQASIEVFRETGEFIGGMGLDDAYYLAESKIYGTVESVRAEFLELTIPHEQLGLDFIEDHVK